MGAICGKASSSAGNGQGAEEGGTLRVMYSRIDKDKKGYISKEDLQHMMRDDKTHGKDANHISKSFITVLFVSWQM
jgi:Ca2+-binding EF-hand superfamily protein